MRNLKKALSLALASVMVLGMMVVGSSAKASPDVKPTHNVKAIELVKTLGVMNGDNAGNWNPEQTLTRNELAIIIAKLANLPLNGSHPFTDVPSWASKYVGALYTNGISAGTSATTYGGDQAVRTVDAALMMVRTLGYLNEKGELKANGGYVLATTKTAQKIGLFDGVKTLVNAPVTRNDIAQMVMNLLNNYLVVCEVKGGANVSGNGLVVDIPGNYDYSVVVTYDEHGNKIPQTLLNRTFETTMEKLSDGQANKDAFGRPAVQFKYGKSVSAIVPSEAPVAVYNEEFEAKDLKKVTGVKDVTDYNLYVNGETSSISADTDKLGGDGIATEVYVIKHKDAEDDVIVCSIEYKVGTVTNVKKADAKNDVKRSITVDGKSFETEQFAKDDVVVYTLGDKTLGDSGYEAAIQTVELAKKVTGKVTKVDNGNFYIDGVKYALAKNGKDDNLTIGATVDAYLANGAIFMAKVVEEASKDFAYVVDTRTEGGWSSGKNNKYIAKLVLADGSQVEAEYKYDDDNVSSTPVVALTAGSVVKYTVKDGVYMIGKDGEQKAADHAVKFSGKNPADLGNGYVANDSTVFVINEGTQDAPKFVVVTGVKNVPNFDKEKLTEIKAVCFATKDKIADIVFVTAGVKASNAAEETMFILVDDSDKVEEMVNDDKVVYYSYKAVVKGEITTVKVDTTKVDATGLYKNIKINDKGVITDAADVVAKAGEVVLGKTVTTAAKNGTIVIDGNAYAYGADVQVYKAVEADKTLESISIYDLEKTNTLNTVVLKDNAVLAIYVVK